MLRILGRVAVAVVCASLVGTAAAQETPAAKATRKKLQQKISIEFKDTRMQDAMNEIKSELNDRISFKIDTMSGVSNNTKVSFKAEDTPAQKVLDAFCTKNDLGWFVLSDKKSRYDGWIIIKRGNERGYEKGKGPKETKESSALPPARDAAVLTSRPPEAIIAARFSR
jgi:hypothetical protein